jgi:hypothetical protein
LEHLLAEGHPLEAVSTLGWMARSEDGFGGLAAKSLLAAGLEPAMNMLASREDPVGLAAAAAEAEGAGIEPPAGLKQAVDAARHSLGLRSAVPALDRARALAREDRWSDSAALLQGALAGLDEDPSARSAMTVLLAEALWREGRGPEALTRLEQSLAREEAASREMLVLRADIRFEAGETELACADYQTAREMGPSLWVDHQVASCGPEERGSTEGAK